MKDPATDLLKAALWYAKHGLPVFPCHGIVDDRCTCPDPACEHPGKHPASSHGFYDATTDVTTIERWWRKNPNFNIGMVTGALSEVTVLDIDPRHGGDESLEALIGKYGPLPATAEQITGGGGKHIAVKYVFPVARTTLAEGIDIKSDGGYIVVAPSVHKSGRAYQWDGIDGAKALLHLALTPDWLMELLGTPVNGTGSHGPQPIPEKIPHGQQHKTLVSLAGTLRKRGLGEDEIFASLWVVNNARCEIPGPEENIRKIAASVCKLYPPGKIGGGNGFRDEDDPGPEPGAARAKRPEPPHVLNLDEVLALNRPKASMLIESILPAAGCSLIIGPSKCGKTLSAVQMAIAVASGEALYRNYSVVKSGAVLVVEQDDPAGGAGVKEVLEVSPVPITKIPFHLVERSDHQLGLTFTQWLEGQIVKLGLRLIVLDSYTALRGSRGAGGDIVKAEAFDISQLDELGKRVAQRLYEHTHRLSSPAEITRYHADERQRAADLALAESSRKQRERGILLEGPPAGDDHRIKSLESQLADMKQRLDEQQNGGKHGGK